MSIRHIACAAALLAFTGACAASGHAPAALADTAEAPAPIAGESLVPEFHGAAIGADALRGQLNAE